MNSKDVEGSFWPTLYLVVGLRTTGSTCAQNLLDTLRKADNTQSGKLKDAVEQMEKVRMQKRGTLFGTRNPPAGAPA